METKIFSIEGNIGAGKSTLISILEKQIPDCIFLYEPVNKWKNIGNFDLLSYFYKDPKRWCFTFELYSMWSKFKRLKEALKQNPKFIIMERSLFSDRAFHHISYYYDKLNVMEMSILEELYHEFKSNYPKLSGIIYVDTNEDLCLKRIKIRSRPEEQGITADYLKMLNDQFINTEYECKFVYVDGEYDLRNSQEIISKIKLFITQASKFQANPQAKTQAKTQANKTDFDKPNPQTQSKSSQSP